MNKSQATTAYSILQGSMWSFYAIVLGFSSNFLYHYGFQDSHISLLLGASTAGACVLQLGAAELISRFKKLTVYTVLLSMGAFMLLGSLAMLNPWHGGLAVGGLALACAVLQAIPAMGNAIAMTAINRGHNTNYSIARGFGSAAYSLFALITGRLVSRFGTTAISVLATANSVIFLLSVLWYHAQIRLAVPAETVRREAIPGKSGFLSTHRYFSLFLLGSILLFISHNLVCNFMLQIISAKGGNASHQGTATAIAAMTELPVMFGFALLLKWLRCEKWVQLSGIFFAVKALGLYLAADYHGVYVAQATQLLGFAVFSIASVHYARLAVEKDESVRAQSYLASTSAIGGLFATSTGGLLCQWFGAQTMVLVAAGFAVAGTMVVTLGINLRKRNQFPCS